MAKTIHSQPMGKKGKDDVEVPQVDVKRQTAHIKKYLRLAWLRSPERNEAIKQARVTRGLFKCAECDKIVRRQSFEVDHIVGLKPFVDWNTHISRLFCNPFTGLQILCKECHLFKSGRGYYTITGERSEN